jgi:hypothetical protein
MSIDSDMQEAKSKIENSFSVYIVIALHYIYIGFKKLYFYLGRMVGVTAD